MNTNDIERSENIIPDEELKNAVGGTDSLGRTKYRIGDVFTYNNITDQRYILVGIGAVDTDGEQRYILDYQEYQRRLPDHDPRDRKLVNETLYAWVSLGLCEKYESFIDQFFTKI